MNTSVFIDTFPIIVSNDLTLNNKNNQLRTGTDSLPIWSFSFIVGVDSKTVSWENGFDNVSEKIHAQFDSINNRFNNAGVFDGIINFYVDSIFMFVDSIPMVNNSESDFMLQYYMNIEDNFVGLYNWETQVVKIEWPIFVDGGVFGARVTDVLTHEFGHTRGAIDIYWEHVPSENNPVNGEEFPYDSTIMGTTYYGRIWDEHSYNMINRSKDAISLSIFNLKDYFPDTIGISVQGLDSNSISNARVKVYIVPFGTFKLYENPIIDTYTNENGKVVFNLNPYHPNSYSIPIYVSNINLMITVEKSGHSSFTWMTLADVQVSYFIDSTAPYYTNIIMEDIVLDIHENELLVNHFDLQQNYPNPFNPSTTITFTLSKKTFVTLEILNIKGQTVKTLLNNQVGFGTHSIEWDGTNNAAHKISSGIYYYRLQTDDYVQTKKMSLLK